jgi:hypothetical protein
MEKRRKPERFNLNLDVIEQTTDNYIGSTGNIHHEGLMLISKVELALSLDIPIWLEMLGDKGIESKIPLFINGVWNKKTMYHGIYHTGCRIVEPSPEDIHEIDELMSYKQKRAHV